MKRGWLLGVGAATFWAAACGGGAQVVVTPPNNGFTNSNLQGQYAFSMAGTDVVSGTPFARVGSFIADGKGNITGGNEDVTILQGGSQELSFTSGTYTVNSDGRGTLGLTDNTGTITFSISLASSSNGYLVLMPTDLMSTASGSFVKQNTTSFTLAGLTGNYAFDFSGVDPNGLSESIVGQFLATPGASLGQISGFADDNDGGTINGGNNPGNAAPIAGTYAAPSTSPNDLTNFGRGQFTIGTLSGVFYIVGPNQIKFMETSSGGTLSGDSFGQSNIPTTTAGLSSGFVYVLGGSTNSNAGFGPVTRGGRFSASRGTLSNIILDTNNAGQSTSFPPTGGTSSGTYTIDPSGNGRGTLTYTVQGLSATLNYVFYMISPTQAFVQDQTVGTNGAFIEDGSMFQQGSGSTTDSSLAGNYAINWSGVTSTNGGFVGEEDLVGETTLSSVAALTGTIDLNESGPQGTGIPLTGMLQLNSANPTSHATLTINLATNPANNGITAFAYIAANNNILIMTTQTVRIAAGVMTPQAP